MFVIYLALTLGLLYLHLLSVTLLAARWLPLPLARVGGLLLVLLLVFFIEHFVGLGKLAWLWPISGALAGAIVFNQRQRLRERAVQYAELAFVLAFGFGLVWRIILPDIHASSERLTDLYFIANYYNGVTLPGPDLWFAGHRFDFYYAFQHYCAALMGRWFGMQVGLAYNISFALLTGLALALAWDVVQRLVANRIYRGVLIVALAMGGTGVTPLFDFLIQAPAGTPPEAIANDHMWGGSRFIGNFEARVNTDLGRSLLPPVDPASVPAGFQPLDLPMENFGYHYFVGDYHPPLGAFLLLYFMLALIAWVEQPDLPDSSVISASPKPAGGLPNHALAAFFLALSVPAMLVTNAWILPMQALLLGLWAASRWLRKLVLPWRCLLVGGAVGFLLIYPFMAYFVAQVVPTSIRLVSAPNFTPLSRLLLVMWPLLALFALLALEGRRRPLAWVMLLCFGLMLLAGELLWVDDPNGGRYERNNTTMKWWGWMWSGALLSAGALALSSSQRWLRLAAMLVLLGPAWQLINTLQYWYYQPRPNLARLEGHHWLSQDRAMAALINYLKSAPPGLVLENWQGDGYTAQTALALFSGKPSLQGWPNHLNIWRNGAPDIWLLRQQIIDLYKGEGPDALGWLMQHQVQYVVWAHGERNWDEAKWQRMQQALGGAYDWHAFSDQPGNRVGVWVRRQRP